MGIFQGPDPIPGGRSAARDSEYRVTYERKFLVITDDLDDDEELVASSIGFAPQDAHPSNPNVRITAIQVQEGDRVALPGGLQGCRWEVTLSYGYIAPFDLHPSGNPLAKPIKVSFNSEKHESICLMGWDPADLTIDHPTKPVVNSVGDFYDPPIMGDAFRGTLVIERNEEFPASLYNLGMLSNRTNSASIWGFSQYTLKSAPIKFPPREVDEVSGVEFYPMVYEFEFLPETWAERVYNTGYRQKKSGKLIKILDEAGDELQTPGFLTSTGAYLAPPVAFADIVSRAVHRYRPLDYTIFGFPSTLG